jgi:hypothetical protein
MSEREPSKPEREPTISFYIQIGFADERVAAAQAQGRPEGQKVFDELIDSHAWFKIVPVVWEEDDRDVQNFRFVSHRMKPHTSPEMMMERATLAMHDWLMANNLADAEPILASLRYRYSNGDEYSLNYSYTIETKLLLNAFAQFTELNPADFK